MKKRNTDGFALIYVVVVIFILCAIALALMSSTLRTLQAQEASIRRMEQKYAAQGEIERLVAELDIQKYESPHTTSEVSFSDGVRYLSDFLSTYVSSNSALELNSFVQVGDSKIFKIEIISCPEDSLVAVSCKISVDSGIYTDSEVITTKEAVYDANNQLVKAEETETRYWYIVDVSNVNFETYEITSTGGETE